MIKTTVKIDGMMCGMCESHVCDTLRNKCGFNKVSASHKKGIAEIITEESINEDAVISAIGETGYKVTGFSYEEYKKKKLFGR